MLHNRLTAPITYCKLSGELLKSKLIELGYKVERNVHTLYISW